MSKYLDHGYNSMVKRIPLKPKFDSKYTHKQQQKQQQ